MVALLIRVRTLFLWRYHSGEDSTPPVRPACFDHRVRCSLLSQTVLEDAIPQTQHRRIVGLKLKDAFDLRQQSFGCVITQGGADVRHQVSQFGLMIMLDDLQFFGAEPEGNT